MTSPVIALAADHAGFALKNSVKAVLEEHGLPLVDLGPETADPVDYPDMAGKLAAALQDDQTQRGERKHPTCTLVLLTLAAPAGAAELMTASRVAQALGFDRVAEQKLLAGIPSIR